MSNHAAAIAVIQSRIIELENRIEASYDESDELSIITLPSGVSWIKTERGLLEKREAFEEEVEQLQSSILELQDEKPDEDHTMFRPRGSVGGVTIGNGWMRNNPDLDYPEGHENMNDDALGRALRSDFSLEQDIISQLNSDFDDMIGPVPVK